MILIPITVLDIGYTGLSAMSWFEGTTMTRAEILTVQADPGLASIAQECFMKYGYDSRINGIAGLALEVLSNLTGTFDIIFVDIAFEAYLSTVESILECKLLALHGVNLVDNVFARGFIADENNMSNVGPKAIEHWQNADWPGFPLTVQKSQGTIQPPEVCDGIPGSRAPAFV
ncbi:hypothetical protein BDV96DRAFT_683369 [Lophiotrema nucula]|uniref:O-methyltransferase n=1 Tax=Lophiotrema nucula TaxID=690887 RepID=A0A6A5ZQ65_9PLEO|nr:hypothetical protein BDV96DRAFT_683369 [Lophiotrema nucula]